MPYLWPHSQFAKTVEGAGEVLDRLDHKSAHVTYFYGQVWPPACPTWECPLT